MPTTTEFFGYTITNLGPLTTTYTAPAECSTATGNIYFAPAQYPFATGAYLSCVPGEYGKCIPSGAAYDRLAKEHVYTWQQEFIPYYSPGLACPKGWTTAGEYAKRKGAPTSGMLTTQSTPTYTGTFAEGITNYLFLTQVWTEVLEDSETLAYCCPSGFVGDDMLNCHSVMGAITELSYTEGCRHTWAETVAYYTGAVATLDGVEATYLSRVKDTEKPGTARFTQTAITAEEDNVVVATKVPAVALVYKNSDVSKGKDSAPDDDKESDSDEGGESGEGNDSDSAKNKAAAPLSVRGMMPVVTVLVSMLAGAGLLAPWLRDGPDQALNTAWQRAGVVIAVFHHPTLPSYRKVCLAAFLSNRAPDVCPGDAFWPQEDVDDMVEAMKEQVTKNGLFKSSEAGHWRAHFAEWTTAIPDREVTAGVFEEMPRASESCEYNSRACKGRNRAYYFRFDREVIFVKHEDGRGLGHWDKYCP